MTQQTGRKAVLDKAINAVLGSRHTLDVYEVTAYSSNNGYPVADLKSVNKPRRNDGDFLDTRVLNDVPVMPLSWGPFSIAAPLSTGDFVLVAFIERSMDEWVTTGKSGNEPLDSRRMDLNDAVVLSRLRPSTEPFSSDDVKDNALVISSENARIEIRADGTIVAESANLLLGGPGAAQFVALANLVDTFITLVDSVLSTWVPLPTDGGTAFKTAWLAARALAYPGGTVGSVGASKVKAE